jgi:hypothetical protein
MVLLIGSLSLCENSFSFLIYVGKKDKLKLKIKLLVTDSLVKRGSYFKGANGVNLKKEKDVIVLICLSVFLYVKLLAKLWQNIEIISVIFNTRIYFLNMD